MIGLRNTSYIDTQLVLWGVYKRWLERGGSIGGPKRVRSWWGPVITDRLLQGHGIKTTGGQDECPVNIEEARDMDACVSALLGVDEDLHQVVMECWYLGGTVEQQVQACGCALKTYYRRLERAKDELLGLLQDKLAGIPLPKACPAPQNEDD